MAVRRIGRMLEMLGVGATQQARNDATSDVDPRLAARAQGGQAFMLQGVVVRVFDASSLAPPYGIAGPQGIVLATTATDEPIMAGAIVWYSQTRDGSWVIHGTVKG